MTKKDVEIFVDDNEKYIQINDVDIADIEKVWEQLQTSYPGFVADFCFHNTPAPEKFLLAAGAELLDNCEEMRLSSKDFVDLPMASGGDVTPVTTENFADFAAYHDRACPDMYWSSRRLLSDFAAWDIFTMQRQGEISGYVIMRGKTEIYCVQTDSLDDKTALINMAAKAAFAAQDEGTDTDILFMVDRDNFTEVGAAMHLGFRRTGYYVAYRAKV